MKNSIPVITANFEPFKVILQNETEQSWLASLDEINNNNYDYEGFNEIVGVVDIGISPYSLAISRDGTLHLPRINKYLDLTIALFEFNQFLTCLFLGGEYCEVVWSDDIGFGFIFDNKTSMICSGAEGKAGKFHRQAKVGHLSMAERINLHIPQAVSLKKLKDSYDKGKVIVNFLENMSFQPLLYGATFYRNRNYSESLINFWSMTEMLIEKYWKDKILSSSKDHKIAIKINVLYENGLIKSDLKTNLDCVRNARNKLAHRGKLPDVETVLLAIECVFKILSLVTSNFEKCDEYSYLITMLEKVGLANKVIFSVDQEIEITTWFESFEDSSNVNFFTVNR